jgi:hypothetical protein
MKWWKRGPKPVDMGRLTRWELEFNKALRYLRDGIFAPVTNSPIPSGLSRAELRSFVGLLRQMTPEHYLLTTRHLTKEMGHSVKLEPRPKTWERWWAEQHKADEIRWLEQELNPITVRDLDRRRRIWTSLVEADSPNALRAACEQWAQLPDVRKMGMSLFPNHVGANAEQFLSMKSNVRFPRSAYGDDSRLEYLARGMAGVLCGVSPMTGIERLRNMKHERGGPFWEIQIAERELPVSEQYCRCWRCSLEKSSEASNFLREGPENGLRAFMKLAESTKVPVQWKDSR